MAYSSFEQLTTTITLQEAEQELLEFLADQNIETTDWRLGSPELTLVKTLAFVYYTLVNRAASLTNQSLNLYASGTFLSVLANSHFDNQRVSGSFTIGKMVVTGSAAVVPRTFQASELKVTDGNYVFYNENQFTISHANPWVSESFKAENLGADYNISTNATLTFVGNQTGFSVTNPPISGSSTWISTLGSDIESDNTLRQRNAAKWSALQTGDLTIDRCKLIALSASSGEVNYIAVDDSNPRGPYTVDVYLSKELSTATEATAAVVQNTFNTAWFGNASTQRVSASIADELEFNRNITILYKPAYTESVVESVVIDAIEEWIKTIPIGGNDYLPVTSSCASIYDLTKDLESLASVEKIIISPATDIALTYKEKLVPASSWSSKLTFSKLTS